MVEDDWQSVAELQAQGILLVEDGNHGESRPRPEEFGSSGIAFVRAANLSDGRVNFDDCEHINATARERIRKGIGQPSDILLSHKGTVGKLAMVSEEAPAFVCSPQTTFWRVLDTKRLDRAYLYGFMRSRLFTNQLQSVQGETDMAPYVSLTAQRRLRIPVPGLREQFAVGEILSVLDRKIELNRRMAENLEMMARTLFSSLFVGFDPVHARVAHLPTGLSDQFTALIPNRFGEDGLPIEWTKRPISALGQFLNGLALQKFPAADGEASLPVIKIAELRVGPTSKSDRASISVPADYIVRDGDHLFSWSGSLTHCRWSHGIGALNRHLFKVTAQACPSWFLYQAVKYFLPEFRAIASEKAVTIGHIQRRHLDQAMIAMPPAPVMDAADRVLRPMHDRVLMLALQCRTLTALRDALLPKLISGELRVAGAEQRVAAA